MSDSAMLWTVAHQAPLSIGLSRREYWNGLLCPFPGDLLDPGIKTASPALAGGFFTTEPSRKPTRYTVVLNRCYWPPSSQPKRTLRNLVGFKETQTRSIMSIQSPLSFICSFWQYILTAHQFIQLLASTSGTLNN